MANYLPAFQFAQRIGHHADNLAFNRDRKDTLLNIALTGATLGVGGAALSGTRAAAYGGTALKWFGYARRPVLSFGVQQGYRGASTLMGVSKAYAITMLGIGIHEFDQNQALAREKEWKRLGINLMGPPGSLWFYDNIYNGPASESLASSSSPSQQNGGAKGKKTSKFKKSKDSHPMGQAFYEWDMNGRSWNPCPEKYKPRKVKGRWMCVKK